MQLHGPILTHCYKLADLATCIKNGKYNALKVITGWGSPIGWTRQAMTEVMAMCQYLVIRTVAGDPSYNNGAQPFPEAAKVVTEIAPWYTVWQSLPAATRPTLFIEIGNEPNRAGWDEDFCWKYRWHLDRAIAACRATYPEAKLIATALLVQPDTNAGRWLDISESDGLVMGRCDYIGIHAYEHDAWVTREQRHGTTGQLQLIDRFYTPRFRSKPWILSEYGINDAATSPILKGQRYAAFAQRQGGAPVLFPQVVGALYYHYCADRVIDPNYHIAPQGDVAYGAAWKGR